MKIGVDSSFLLQIGCSVVVSLHTVLPSSTLCTEQTQFAIFRTVVDKQIIHSAISSMLNAQPSPVVSPETKELTVSPTNGLAPTPRPDDLTLPTAVTQCVPSMQPSVQFESQLLAILSDIDATSSPVASPATQQSVVASPLTERALRYHRRDAFGTDRNNVTSVPSPNSTEPPHALGAEMHEKDRSEFTPAPPRKLFHPTIPNTIPSLNHEQYRSLSFDSLPRMHPEYNAPATFPRATRATYMTEQRSLSAGLRSLPPFPPCFLASPPQNVIFVYDIFCLCRQDRRCGISAFRFGNRPCPPSRAFRTPSGDFLSCGLVHSPGDFRLRNGSHPRPTSGLPRALEGLHGRPLWTPGTPRPPQLLQ